jgi:hypothetical protein
MAQLLGLPGFRVLACGEVGRELEVPGDTTATMTLAPSRLHSRIFTASMAFALISGARHSLHPTPNEAGPLTTPQASHYATDRSVAPTKPWLSTLGFDPTRFQIEPPACYRAS